MHKLIVDSFNDELQKIAAEGFGGAYKGLTGSGSAMIAQRPVQQIGNMQGVSRAMSGANLGFAAPAPRAAAPAIAAAPAARTPWSYGGNTSSQAIHEAAAAPGPAGSARASVAPTLQTNANPNKVNQLISWRNSNQNLKGTDRWNQAQNMINQAYGSNVRHQVNTTTPPAQNFQNVNRGMGSSNYAYQSTAKPSQFTMGQIFGGAPSAAPAPMAQPNVMAAAPRQNLMNRANPIRQSNDVVATPAPVVANKPTTTQAIAMQ